MKPGHDQYIYRHANGYVNSFINPSFYDFLHSHYNFPLRKGKMKFLSLVHFFVYLFYTNQHVKSLLYVLLLRFNCCLFQCMCHVW